MVPVLQRQRQRRRETVSTLKLMVVMQPLIQRETVSNHQERGESVSAGFCVAALLNLQRVGQFFVIEHGLRVADFSLHEFDAEHHVRWSQLVGRNLDGLLVVIHFAHDRKLSPFRRRRVGPSNDSSTVGHADFGSVAMVEERGFHQAAAAVSAQCRSGESTDGCKAAKFFFLTQSFVDLLAD